MSYCGQCANQIQQGKKFCSIDGTPKGKGRNFCNYCGSPLKPNARFCGKCRYEVESNKVPKPPINPVQGQTPKTNPGQCSNCLKQNGLDVTTCVVCGKNIPNPLRLVKPPEAIQPGQCANCKRQNAAGVKICINCKKPIPKPLAPINPPPPIKPGQCANCKRQNVAGVTICINCKKPIPEPLPLINPPPPIKSGQCANCKRQNAEGVIICANCGYKLPHPLLPSPKDGVKRYSSIVDSKGRATIPKQVRELLGVEIGGTVVFTVEGGKVSFTASKSRKARKSAS